ncbi:A24 family peptidase [Shewanella submarina]|uniref:Prepilin leader peptidase/N-methyltransferase n=1 Tax=Shewanella submarina TaxID=2016376 RepID=A0ABV7G7X9_9GAMM|nr:A24 family peptidase [Shewanella submarina]MCL1038284.1 A24 family peptidase [Shewanella submarina]
MSEFLQLMSQHPWLFITLSFIFAATIGSFLNVVIHRMPVMMKREWQQECNAYIEEYHASSLDKSALKKLTAPIDNYPERYNLIAPGSACPKCGNKIKPWQNIPVLGWIMLKGQCANCKTSISARYPVVEALTGLLVAVLAWHFGPNIQFALAALLTFILIALTFIDLDEMLLPDQLTLPLVWLGLLVNLPGTFTDLQSAIIGAVAGYLSLWSVFWLFKLLTGKEGMGYGDFKLMAVFGAWLGWQFLPVIILLSSLVGAIVGIAMILAKRLSREKPIPFGPYIAAAGWIALVYGQQIIDWYLGNML